MRNQVGVLAAANEVRALQAAESGRILLSAAGVHSGGGLVLLRALVGALGGVLQEAIVDHRTRGQVSLPGQCRAVYVGRSPFAKWFTLTKLARRMGPHDVLFCFNSLPPLLRPRGRVVNYVQAPYLVGRDRRVKYGLVKEAQMALERLWFRWGLPNCDVVWVQTATMSRALHAEFPAAKVQVVPFVDDDVAEVLRSTPAPVPPRAPADYGACSFFYPADGMAHKNHAVLLAAWAQLAASGRFPQLRLTLQPPEFDAALRQAGLAAADLPSVQNLGRLPRAEVLQRLRSSSALIFPSRAETFGLPLLEAHALGVAILASERDFVRDVCEPAQSFDPESPVSIAAAVRRFVEGDTGLPARYDSASDLVHRLFSCAP
jgi:glycosyltransferase involved in cell wall biosynthesis